MTRTIAEIEEELAEANRLAFAEAEAKRKAIRPRRRYTIKRLNISKNDTFDRVYDDTIEVYELIGTIENRDEAKAAGHAGYALTDGAMRYFYNTVTRKIIAAAGGGTIYTSSPTTMAKISAFIVDNPDGGDITAIMRQDRSANGWY